MALSKTQCVRYKLAVVISTISLHLAHRMDLVQTRVVQHGVYTLTEGPKEAQAPGGEFTLAWVQDPLRTQCLHFLLESILVNSTLAQGEGGTVSLLLGGCAFSFAEVSAGEMKPDQVSGYYLGLDPGARETVPHHP